MVATARPAKNRGDILDELNFSSEHLFFDRCYIFNCSAMNMSICRRCFVIASQAATKQNSTLEKLRFQGAMSNFYRLTPDLQ